MFADLKMQIMQLILRQTFFRLQKLFKFNEIAEQIIITTAISLNLNFF